MKNALGGFLLQERDRKIIDINSLKQANVVSKGTKIVKVFASGEITKPVTLKGIRVSKGARAAIESAGGIIE